MKVSCFFLIPTGDDHARISAEAVRWEKDTFVFSGFVFVHLHLHKNIGAVSMKVCLLVGLRRKK